ncbi:MAG: DUF6702 family protein [Myxococcota bacterium]
MRAAFAVLMLVSIPAAGHPQHRTTAQIEANMERGVLEVGLRVHPEDLARAVKRFEATEKPVLRYLQSHFQWVQGDAGEAAPIRWVGQEPEGADLWLYFEIPYVSGPGELTHTVFFELFANQINVVRLRVGGKKRTVSLTAKSAPLHIELPTPAPRQK